MLPKYFSPQKAPADSLPYGFNWSDWFSQNAKDLPELAGDTVLSAVITATPPGLTIGSASIDSTGLIATAQVSGGVDQTDYTLSCQIVSVNGLIAVSEQLLQCRACAR